MVSSLLFPSVLLFLPLSSAYYFVLTRYSPLKSSASSLVSGDDRFFLPSISSQSKEAKLPPEDREWTVRMSTLDNESPLGGERNWQKKRGQKGATGKRNAGSAHGATGKRNAGSAHGATGKRNAGSAHGATGKRNAGSAHGATGKRNAGSAHGATGKRNAGSAHGFPLHEHVCTTAIRTDFRPQFGHEQNGTRVEIQQDEYRQFSATFVECSNTKKGNCHGIDNAIFSSECVTLYEFRPAGVRAEGNSAEFVDGFVRVPITCQCQLRRKKKHTIYSN